jgi:hypothetical protein
MVPVVSPGQSPNRRHSFCEGATIENCVHHACMTNRFGVVEKRNEHPRLPASQPKFYRFARPQHATMRQVSKSDQA